MLMDKKFFTFTARDGKNPSWAKEKIGFRGLKQCVEGATHMFKPINYKPCMP